MSCTFSATHRLPAGAEPVGGLAGAALPEQLGDGTDHLNVDLRTEPQQTSAILAGVSRGDWLPWRRDWSKYPNAWKTYLAGSVAFTVLGAVYVMVRDEVGVGYLVLAAVLGFLAHYSFRHSRLGTRPEESDRQPH